MGYNHKAIDADSHVFENPTAWTSRMSKQRWGNRIPEIRERDGKEYWYIDDKEQGVAFNCPAAMPDRFTPPARWEDVPKSVYVPEDRLKAMDIDGVTGVVFYPQLSGASQIFEGRVKMEPEFEEELVRGYNDYVAEEWMGYNKDRFFGLCMVPYSDIERTVGEARRSIKNGHYGVILGSTPEMRGLPHYSDPYWEPLFSMLEEMESTVNFHSQRGMAASMRLENPPGLDRRRSGAGMPASTQSFQAQHYANLLLSGIISRHPKINWVIAESGVGWVPSMLEATDHAWEVGKLWKHGVAEKPSEIFHRQCYNDFWFEREAIQQYRHIVGVDRILWETDFPHPTSLYPNTQEYLANSMEGVPENEQYMMLVENAKRCYHIS